MALSPATAERHLRRPLSTAYRSSRLPGATPVDLGAIRDHVRRNHAAIVADVGELVRIPSVSADPAAAGDVRRCAAALARVLGRVGLADARLVETGRHPLVVATCLDRPGRPTVLIYGHYDVQPAGPTGAWRSAPFAARIVGDELIGRGAADDKGQLLVHVAAIAALRATTGRLPVNVVAIADGAEEIGSPGLPTLLGGPGPWQAVDAAVISDTRMAGPGRPGLTISLRGLLSLDLTVRRPGPAVHAGHLGGALPDPLAALARMVAALHDLDGRIAVPGLYDRVRPIVPRPARRDRRRDARLLAAVGSVAGSGEPGWSIEERTTVRPCLTITGLQGGGVGTHAQATVVTRARATLDLRLVPDQDPAEILRQVQRRLAAVCPPGIRFATRVRSAVRPVAVDLDDRLTEAAEAALVDGFGVAPVRLRSGGSSPAAVALREAGIPLALMGFALPEGRVHGANEALHLPTFERAIVSSASLLARLGEGAAR